MKIVVTPPFTEEQKKRIMEAAGPEQPVFRLKSEIPGALGAPSEMDSAEQRGNGRLL